QLFARPEMLRIAGALLLVLAFVPGLPRPVFVVLALVAFGAAHAAATLRARAVTGIDRERERAKRQAIRRPEMALGLVGVDAVCIEVGADLAPLLASENCEALLDRVGEVRRALAAELGIVLPGVRLRDDLTREPDTYAIRVRDELAAEGRLRLEDLLAVGDEPALAQIDGAQTYEPVYGLNAKWIVPAARDRALQAGALVFDPISIIGSHLAEVARTHAAQLFGRQELQTLLEHLRASVPAVVKEIGGEGIGLPAIQRAFGLLLRERVWPRDPVATLEAMLDAAQSSREPLELAEAARKVLVPSALRRRPGEPLEPLLLDPQFERDLASGPDPAAATALREQAESYASEVSPARAALVCTGSVRPMLAELLLRSGLRLSVFSYTEIPPEVRLLPRGVAGLAEGGG
ncbi:MAG TPA: FHIPEP family type III secretion protein, partial [Candidatus Baltobacteraceae bacterium]|nr:FHIPEP family type III secretion protein [Candidatus Baltobacteraceae bacterium]